MSGQSLHTLAPLVLGIYAQNAKVKGNFMVPTSAAAAAAGQTAVANFFGYQNITEMPSINGQPIVPFERGLPKETSIDIWRSITDDDLKAMNGGQLPTDNAGSASHPVDAAWIISHAFPYFAGRPGQYALGFRDPAGNLVSLRDSSGKPFIWNYGSQAAAYKSRAALRASGEAAAIVKGVGGVAQ